jgi:hypothetical protein
VASVVTGRGVLRVKTNRRYVAYRNAVPSARPTTFAEMLSASLLVRPSRWWLIASVTAENPKPMRLRTVNRHSCLHTSSRSRADRPRQVTSRLPK